MDYTIVAIKVLNILRITFLFAYFKYPWIVSTLVYYDALIRIIESFLPIEWVQARNQVMILLIIDIISNYCGNLYTGILVLNLQFASITIISCYVMIYHVYDAVIEALPMLFILNVFFLLNAIYFGRNTLLHGQY